MSPTRRDFLKLSAAGLVGGGLLRPAVRPDVLLGRPLRNEFTLVRRNVGIFTERGGVIGWLVNSNGVAIVDSQFVDTAPMVVDGLKQRTALPFDLLINSHHHGDHTGGNGILRPVVGKIVAHERSRENQRALAGRRGGPVDESTLPDTVFADTWNVTIGDETIHLKHYGPAHTGGDVTIYFEQANVVHMGDLTNNRGWPNIDAAAGGSVHGWIQVLDQIMPAFPADAIYIFGHFEGGFPPTGTRADLSAQRDYFTAVIEVAQRAIREGRTREQAMEITALPGFEHFGGTASRLGLAVGVAYDELRAQGG